MASPAADAATHAGPIKQNIYKAVAVAHLVERSLPLPEVRGSNPVVGKNLFISIEHLFTVNCVLERRK